MFEIFEGVLNKYHGSEQEIIIPEEVKEIGDFAFYNCTGIEKVTLLDGVETIGQFAFYGCEHLKTIILPESVQRIGAGAFSCCYELENITLPSLLKTLNKSTFYRCYHLEYLALPAGLVTIDRGVFSFCTSLKNIVFPEVLKSIGESAFEGCTRLKKVILPSTVTTIGKKAFYHCENLKNIILSNDLKEVGLAAFETQSKMMVVSEGEFVLTPKMFDEHYMFDVVSKNVGNYQFEHSFMPSVHFEEWKPIAKIILLVNYLEAIEGYETHHPYETYLKSYKTDVIDFMVKNKRFYPLNKALERELIQVDELDPYFDLINDREEKAVIMNYKNKQTTTDSFSDLDNLLDDLF